MSEELKEAVKTGLRVVVLAIIPVIIGMLNSGVVDVKVILTVAAVAALSFVDSWLHEYEVSKPKVDQNKGILGVKGLTGF